MGNAMVRAAVTPSARRAAPVLFLTALLPTTAAVAVEHAWRSPTSGDWHDPSMWNPAGLPDTATDDARINAPSPSDTPYSISLTAPTTVRDIYLQSDAATLRLAAPTDDRLVIDPRFVSISSGVLSVHDDVEVRGSFDNNGVLHVTPNSTLSVIDHRIPTPGHAGDPFYFYNDPTGHLRLDGPLRLHGVTFHHTGKITGDSPILLYHSAVALAGNPIGKPEDHSGTFIFRTSGGLLRVGVGDPHVFAGQTVIVQANDETPAGKNITFGGGVTNLGQLVFETTIPDGAITTADGLNNGGHFVTRGPAGTHRINRSFENWNFATAEFKADAQLPADVLNRGVFDVAPGVTVTGSDSERETFYQAGVINNRGELRILGNFTDEGGGQITGNPVILGIAGGVSHKLRFLDSGSPHAGSFIINGPRRVEGSIGPAVTLTANARPGPASIALTDPVNHGSITLDAGDDPRANTDAVLNANPDSSAPRDFTNFGTLSTRGPTPGYQFGTRADVIANLVNAPGATAEFHTNSSVSGRIENTGLLSVHGSAILRVGGPITNTGTISIAPDARLELSRHSLLDRRPTTALRDAALAEYTALIRSARNAPEGFWLGPGIGTFVAKSLTGLAIAPVSDTDLLIKYTWNGDANVDGKIDADDYFAIDSGFLSQPANPAYTHGDFNYDRQVNADDYFLIDSAFLGQGDPLPAAFTIPEPHALPLVFAAHALAARRWRHRSISRAPARPSP